MDEKQIQMRKKIIKINEENEKNIIKSYKWNKERKYHWKYHPANFLKMIIYKWGFDDEKITIKIFATFKYPLHTLHSFLYG